MLYDQRCRRGSHCCWPYVKGVLCRLGGLLGTLLHFSSEVLLALELLLMIVCQLLGRDYLWRRLREEVLTILQLELLIELAFFGVQFHWLGKRSHDGNEHWHRRYALSKRRKAQVAQASSGEDARLLGRWRERHPSHAVLQIDTRVGKSRLKD